jgi:hypothetical protein
LEHLARFWKTSKAMFAKVGFRRKLLPRSRADLLPTSPRFFQRGRRLAAVESPVTGATLNNVGIDKDGGANPVELTTATDANISPTGFGVGFDIGDGGSGWGTTSARGPS